ncbi:MAG TPA: hypothetical protein VM942_09505 [Acidimicrobiales bacterium]|nr:hypothetical protein [Acidimicrobiales bacterium]
MKHTRLACAAITLAVLASACGEGGQAGSDASSPSAPSTTWSPIIPTTTPFAEPPGPAVTQPEPDVAEPWFDGIWPGTRAALDEQRRAFDEGHQPWRADPVATAAAFLRSVGIEEPVMGSYDRAGGRTGVVRYESGSVPGFVFLRQVEGNPLPYVVRLETPRFELVQTEREGGELRVEVASPTPGTIVARAGSFASEWQDDQQVPVVQGPPITLTLDIDDPRRPVLLEVRHEGADGVASIARVRVQPAVSSSKGSSSRGPSAPSGGERLSTDSQLRVGGFGPVEVGMTLDQALGAAGVPMTITGSRYCEILTAPGGPEFVRFVSTAESEGRITVIGVMSESVSTEAGIRKGSTEAEVQAAYPGGLERLGADDAHRLVHRPADDDDHALAFLVVDSKVVSMETGVADLVEAQEYCS